ncbi:inorganic phosphate transporter [Streptomyces tubercidicus]
MNVAVLIAAAAFVALVGRNDGASLAATALKAAQGSGRWIPAMTLLALPVAPLLGLDAVAASLAELFGPSFGDPAGAISLLIAVLATVVISLALAVPTSVTLALVGALSGTVLGAGHTPDWAYMARMLGLAAVAPLVAAFLALSLSRLPLPALGRPERSNAVLARCRTAAFCALALAYSLNDGQKVTFVAAIALHTSIHEAATSPWIQLAAVALFALGMTPGLKSSGRALRQGVFSPAPLPILWAQLSSVASIAAGSALGAPLSMTQSLQGAVLGTGLARGRRSVRWQAAGRIGMAWIWTLPVATGTSFALTALIKLATTGGTP